MAAHYLLIGIQLGALIGASVAVVRAALLNRRLAQELLEHAQWQHAYSLLLSTTTAELVALMTQHACPLPNPGTPGGVLPLVGLITHAAPTSPSPN